MFIGSERDDRHTRNRCERKDYAIKPARNVRAGVASVEDQVSGREKQLAGPVASSTPENTDC